MLLVLAPHAAFAASPVWSEWSADTLRRSVAADKPVLLLVVDSTCDRCREVENGLKAEAFTQVILDRDLYPVIARAYGRFAIGSTGRDDLPLLVALTPHLEPVGASPDPDDEHVRLFVADIEARWGRERDAVIADGGLVVRRLQLGTAPAIATPSNAPLERLRPLPVAERGAALVEMQKTAVYDQLGGGFHRLARDAEWRVPQFDKVLEEQAAIASIALDTWKATGDPTIGALLRATLDCIVRDFTDPRSRAFANAIASHSLVARKGAELLDGGVYTWRQSEVAKVLGRDAAAFESRFGISPDGNVRREMDPHGDFAGVNILFIAEDRAETKRRFALTDKELDDLDARSRAKLLTVRLKRPQPALDARVITATNAHAISLLARAGVDLGSTEYQEAAAQTLRALLSRNVDVKTRKVFRYRAATTVEGTLDDYTALIRALLDVYSTTFDPAQLELAIALQQKTDEMFFTGGRYANDAGVPDAVQGLAGIEDACAARIGRNLLELGAIVGSEPWRVRGASMLGVEPDSVPPQVVAVLGSLGAPETQALVAAARKRREPLLVLYSRAVKQRLSAIVPPLEKLEFNPEATATICSMQGCRSVVKEADALRALP